MTTLAGSKIRRHRYAQRPRMTRSSFGDRYGRVAPTTVQGWEEEGKRPASRETVNAIAAAGIASHEDWFRVDSCPRCTVPADAEEASSCTQRDCPLAVRSVA